MKLKNSETEQRRGRNRFPEVESDNRWAGRQPRKGRRRSRSRMGLWECGQSQFRTRKQRRQGLSEGFPSNPCFP